MSDHQNTDGTDLQRRDILHTAGAVMIGGLAASFEGELTLILGRGEATIGAGDIVIQRGTNHAWANRSTKNCRVAFILIDGQFAEGL